MNRKTPTVEAADLKVARLNCAHCGAVTRVSRLSATYPVKLPAPCPCCLRPIYAYTWESADGAS